MPRRPSLSRDLLLLLIRVHGGVGLLLLLGEIRGPVLLLLLLSVSGGRVPVGQHMRKAHLWFDPTKICENVYIYIVSVLLYHKISYLSRNFLCKRFL